MENMFLQTDIDIALANCGSYEIFSRPLSLFAIHLPCTDFNNSYSAAFQDLQKRGYVIYHLTLNM